MVNLNLPSYLDCIEEIVNTYAEQECAEVTIEADRTRINCYDGTITVYHDGYVEVEDEDGAIKISYHKSMV